MNLDRFRHPAGSPALPLAAMIDVLFLTIIFLVLGANFDQRETVRLPQAHGEAGVDPTALTLQVRADGTLLLGQEPVVAQAVLPRIAAASPVSVLLLPDREAQVGQLFLWYDRIQNELGVPVRVGVRPKASP